MKISENKRRAKIGRELLSHLRPIRSLREVGRLLGATGQNISLIEEQAAYKLATRMRKAIGKDYEQS